MRSFFTLKTFFQSHIWEYSIGIFLLIIVDILQLITPKILGAFTDILKSGQLTFRHTVYYTSVVLTVALCIAGLRYFWRIYILGTSRKLEYYLRNRLYSHIQSLSSSFFDKRNPGELMALSTNDVNAVRMAIGVGMIMFIDGVFLTVAAILIMFKTIHIPLTLATLTPLPCILILAVYLGKLVHRRFTKVQEAFSALTDTVQESIAGIRVIKGYVQEPDTYARFTQTNQLAVDKNLELAKLQSLFIPVTHSLPALCFLIALLYGGSLVIYDEISLGDFVAFYSYLGILIWPVMGLGWLVNLIQRGAASMERINKILAESPSIVDSPQVNPINHLQGKIDTQNLTFRYSPDSPITLEKISLQIPAGTTLGIVGRTGSGKSTFVQLLLRLYDPAENMLYVDDREIHTIPLATLRKDIGYVPQDSLLFSTSIRDNIAFDQSYAEDEIWNAARIACIDDQIKDFPQGMDTFIGERGITLSGGQKQRVSIARAIIKDSPILILDDSFSAIDTRTQTQILHNLREYRQGRTTIIISHRISTLQDADQIVVLEDGDIVERGTHQALLEESGIYSRMHQQQLLQEEINATEGDGNDVS
jgi:ATP-binding cassette, subfamily B, multidrug efflux pump